MLLSLSLSLTDSVSCQPRRGTVAGIIVSIIGTTILVIVITNIRTNNSH